MKISLEMVILIGGLIGGIIKAFYTHSPKGSKLDKVLVWLVAALQEEHLRAIYDLATDPAARRDEAIRFVKRISMPLPIEINDKLAGHLVDYVVENWPNISALFGKVARK